MAIFCVSFVTEYSNCVEIPGTRNTDYETEYEDSPDLVRAFKDARRDAEARLKATASTFDKWGFNL